MRRIVGCGLALVAMGSPLAARAAPAGDFCPVLKAVVAEAANDFAKLKGSQAGPAERDGGGYVTVMYATSQMLPGAASCAVQSYQPPDGEAKFSYVCRFAPTGTRQATAQRLWRAAEDCVGEGSQLDEIDGFGVDEASGSVNGRSFDLSVGAGTAALVQVMIHPGIRVHHAR